MFCFQMRPKFGPPTFRTFGTFRLDIETMKLETVRLEVEIKHPSGNDSWDVPSPAAGSIGDWQEIAVVDYGQNITKLRQFDQLSSKVTMFDQCLVNVPKFWGAST